MLVKTELKDVGILVTRPAHQADFLCNEITSRGGRALRLPVLEIADPLDLQPALSIIDDLENYDLAIFISPNAVARGVALVNSKRKWPQHLEIAAIGQRTAQDLAQLGITTTIVPQDQYNSDALLELPIMKKISGKKIIIFRGEGGRELLADILRQRGASVNYAQVYRRVKPTLGFLQLLKPYKVQDVDIIVVTSNESLQNLYELCAQDLLTNWLQDVPLIVVSERAVALAKELGFNKKPIVSSLPGDQAIIDALIHWKNSIYPELYTHDR